MTGEKKGGDDEGWIATAFSKACNDEREKLIATAFSKPRNDGGEERGMAEGWIATP